MGMGKGMGEVRGREGECGVVLQVIFCQKCQIITCCSGLGVTLQVLNYLQPEVEVCSKTRYHFFRISRIQHEL